jgi:hypothetical protein
MFFGSATRQLLLPHLLQEVSKWFTIRLLLPGVPALDGLLLSCFCCQLLADLPWTRPFHTRFVCYAACCSCCCCCCQVFKPWMDYMVDHAITNAAIEKTNMMQALEGLSRHTERLTERQRCNNNAGT